MAQNASIAMTNRDRWRRLLHERRARLASKKTLVEDYLD